MSDGQLPALRPTGGFVCVAFVIDAHDVAARQMDGPAAGMGKDVGGDAATAIERCP